MMLLESFLLTIVIQAVFFLYAALHKTDKLTDLSYGLTFIIVSGIILLFSGFSAVKAILFLMVFLWAARLAAYLFIRILKTQKDDRFDGIREDPLKFAQFWTLQGIAIWIILLPATILFSKSVGFSVLSLFGLITWLKGFVIESVADMQKSAFKAAGNKGIITTGLWKYSRHPNYFGEILVWSGIFLYALPYLQGLELLSIASPIFITILLVFVSGIPPLQKKQEEKYGKDKGFQEYKRKTSVLIPWFPKR
jgi:steroid 5-alpha reductase family enzyme